MPTPPPFSREERIENLKKACFARTKRKEVKYQVTEGNISIFEVIQLGQKDEIIGKMKTIELLISIPGLGRRRATAMMDNLGISQNRRIRGLGTQQIAKLIDAIRFY